MEDKLKALEKVLHEIEKEYGHPVFKGPVIGTINCFNAKTGELTVDLEFDFMEMWQNGSFKLRYFYCCKKWVSSCYACSN